METRGRELVLVTANLHRQVLCAARPHSKCFRCISAFKSQPPIIIYGHVVDEAILGDQGRSTRPWRQCPTHAACVRAPQADRLPSLSLTCCVTVGNSGDCFVPQSSRV